MLMMKAVGHNAFSFKLCRLRPHSSALTLLSSFQESRASYHFSFLQGMKTRPNSNLNIINLLNIHAKPEMFIFGAIEIGSFFFLTLNY